MSEGLQRFRDAQKDDYDIALSEIKSGRWGPREACFVGRGGAAKRILQSAAFQAGCEGVELATTSLQYVMTGIDGVRRRKPNSTTRSTTR